MEFLWYECSFCGRKMAWNGLGIVTDNDIFTTCSDDCYEKMCEEIDNDPEYYGGSRRC